MTARTATYAYAMSKNVSPVGLKSRGAEWDSPHLFVRRTAAGLTKVADSRLSAKRLQTGQRNANGTQAQKAKIFPKKKKFISFLRRSALFQVF